MASSARRSLVLLCRHGETAANAEGRVQGAGLDPPLNEKGREQARALGGLLADLEVHGAFASELQRARETAEAILEARDSSCAAKKKGLSVVPELKEMNYGQLEGQLLKDIRTDIQSVSEAWARGDRDAACPGGGESPRLVFDRAHAAIQSICAAHAPGSKLLFVTHSRLNKVLLSELHADKPGMHKVPQHNCCVNVLSFDHDSAAVEVHAINLTTADELRAAL
ncbi:6-phosphofructo-2-kinase/fructose-2,6-bisphosphatase 2 [Hondaea fermentalgiana]|uniref:6-phosphofructo-2-kinase/fructose-2,6-bisphosphatase 2 n=1 Tax=Hondaea fermentalgiana TaxID=2315210 RepID=A0A2R5GI74_9STRA|nr:6-phosphofructo-2-kinase/fructose-2,6-bisphosphatase 2 [Hondaea fermentalgiana]|eukprot:GBG30587.1 6-phosphofructo-2-kinase/fructose-2,6-bisphosphatase 2 [Hondaea fermentalgiana]